MEPHGNLNPVASRASSPTTDLNVGMSGGLCVSPALWYLGRKKEQNLPKEYSRVRRPAADSPSLFTLRRASVCGSRPRALLRLKEAPPTVRPSQPAVPTLQLAWPTGAPANGEQGALPHPRTPRFPTATARPTRPSGPTARPIPGGWTASGPCVHFTSPAEMSPKRPAGAGGLSSKLCKTPSGWGLRPQHPPCRFPREDGGQQPRDVPCL